MSMWAPIPGFPGYEVSDNGEVRSLSRMKRGKLLRQTDNGTGYRYVGLRRDGRQLKVYVHRAVLRAFVGEPLDAHASHLNGDRADNRLINLCWESAAENNARKVDHGTEQRGERVGTSRLTVDAVRAIRALYAAGGITQRALAARFGVSQRQVLSIVKRRSWRHVDG